MSIFKKAWKKVKKVGEDIGKTVKDIGKTVWEISPHGRVAGAISDISKGKSFGEILEKRVIKGTPIGLIYNVGRGVVENKPILEVIGTGLKDIGLINLQQSLLGGIFGGFGGIGRGLLGLSGLQILGGEALTKIGSKKEAGSGEEAKAGIGIPTFPTIDIRLPDYSEALKRLEERGREIYEAERGRILEDLSKMRGLTYEDLSKMRETALSDISKMRETALSDISKMRETALSDISKMRELTYSDLNKLLGMDVWEKPIEQATEIARREAMRFMDVAGLGGLGAAPLLMSEIVQKATQPLFVEKARGQQALMEMAQRGLQEIGLTGLRGLQEIGLTGLRGLQEIGLTGLRGLQEIGLTGLRGLQEQNILAQRGLQELGAGFTEYMFGLPFKTFDQALKEAGFKYGTALELFRAQLEPYKLILGTQSQEVPPPSFFEDIGTFLSGFLG
jgi:hypothetical protein